MIIADLFQVLRRLICGLFEITDNEYLFQGLSLYSSSHRQTSLFRVPKILFHSSDDDDGFNCV
jgi:hypothetical protein